MFLWFLMCWLFCCCCCLLFFVVCFDVFACLNMFCCFICDTIFVKGRFGFAFVCCLNSAEEVRSVECFTSSADRIVCHRLYSKAQVVRNSKQQQQNNKKQQDTTTRGISNYLSLSRIENQLSQGKGNRGAPLGTLRCSIELPEES